MKSFDESRFRTDLDNALKRIKTILDNTRNPQYPSDVPHSYEDKYQLVEFATNSAMAAQLNCLVSLGLNQKKMQQLLDWSKARSVTLRLKSEERCTFDREETKKVEAPTKHVTEVSGILGTATITNKVINTVVEYFWKFEVEYELFAFQGNNPEEKVVFQGRRGITEIKTTVKTTPKPQVSVVPVKDVNISWLLQHTGQNMAMNFSIDRSVQSCRTPRRNQNVDFALNYFLAFFGWCESVRGYFVGSVFPFQHGHSLDLGKINDSGIFVPVVPLLEANASKLELATLEGSKSTVKTLPGLVFVKDINSYLDEQKRNLQEKFAELATMFQETKKLITHAEATFVTTVIHAKQISQSYSDTVDYIESLLHKQLVAAIGKEVTATDFTKYMRFHERLLFKEEYLPQPFSYAIRRPLHDPEGVISIEEQLHDGQLADPIQTVVKSTVATKPMKFSISSSCQASFFGERYVHTWMTHKFSGQASSSLQFVARARQFSSFIVMIGRIIGSDVFEPKYATIIQNKDDLKIPLLLQQIPAPKEFKDAIESLSPEQKRFAKAFRSMQLSSTLFAVAVVQIKPQLEKLLKLEDDSLTKEIKLTQDLMEIFIKYQIPSDLLSYGGSESDPRNTKLAAVKRHVAAIQQMIKQAKDKELEEQKEAARLANLKKMEELRVASRQMSFARSSSINMVSDSLECSMDFDSIPESSAALESFSHAPASVAPGKTAVAATPTPKTSTTSTQNDLQVQSQNQREEISPPEEEVDYTKIPGTLDSQFLKLDEDAAVRPTIINPGDIWEKRVQKTLLSKPQDEYLRNEGQEKSRNVAFDLIDALTRSGALPFEHGELHVVLAATHCFDKTLINTIVQNNVNPIEKVERSCLIAASVVHNKHPAELVQPDQLSRVSTYSPILFGIPSSQKALASTEED